MSSSKDGRDVCGHRCVEARDGVEGSDHGAQESLEREAGEQRAAEFAEALEAGQQREVFGAAFAETEAGVEHDAVLQDACGAGRGEALVEAVEHQSHDVGRGDGGLGAPFRGPAAGVHQDKAGMEFGDGVTHVVVPQQTGDIVDDLGAHTGGGARGRGVVGVDGNDCGGSLVQHGFEDREQAHLLGVRADGERAGASGFRAEVEDVRSAIDTLEGNFNRFVMRGMGEAVAGETVRREVHGGHHQRALAKRQTARAELPVEGRSGRKTHVQIVAALVSGGGGVVENDLPTGGRFLQHKRVEAIGVAAAGGSAFEMEVADHGGKARVERMNFDIRESEYAHRGFVGIILAVTRDHAVIAATDGRADEENVGGVLVARGEGVEVAAVPVGGLPGEHGADAGLVGGGGLLGCGRQREKKREEGESEESREAHEKLQSEESVSAGAYNIGMSPAAPGTKIVHAVCTHDCPDSCGVLVTVDTLTGRATKVQGDPGHPVTRGFLCGKVARYLDRVYSPERLLYPMRRKSGVAKGPLTKGREAEAFERISWDEALDSIAAKFKTIATEFGPESILPYSYAGTIGQLGFGSMDRRFFYRLGASQLDRTICSSAGGEALMRVYGVKLGTTPQDFAHAGLVVVWGGNVHGNNIHLWPFIEEARRKGARLIVIDPYKTRTAALADEHLAVRPGTDVLLALAVMHVLFREGMEDREYMRECTTGWEELRTHALREEHSPARAAEVTGIDAETIERLALAYGRSGCDGRGPAVIRLNYGIQRGERGGTAVRSVAMLPLITGSWKQRGGGMQLSTSGSFPWNSKKLHMPELMQASPLGRAARFVNMNQLGHALTELGQSAGHSIAAACESGPPVKALFVYNCNAAAVAPDSTRVHAGLRREDLFTVVHEQFWTDTTDYADIVLPATTFLETKDVMGAYGHLFAQISQRAIEPLGEARSNVDLFAALGKRMGFEDAAFEDDADALIAQALDTQHPWFAGITKKRLEHENQIQLTLPVNERGESLPFSTAAWFGTPSGKGELLPLPEFVAPRESRTGANASGRFPLEFLGRKADNYMNTTFANIPAHQEMERRSAGVLEMHASDAAARDIATGDDVEIWNDRGQIMLTARVGVNGDAKVGPGVVSARLDWQKLSRDGKNVNALTSQVLTDFGGGATFYSTLVEVGKIDSVAAD